jgi:hypothetical protein
MKHRIQYDVCPACGTDNLELRDPCPACDNRLSSDDDDQHQRYVTVIESEHRKRNFLWYGGWAFVSLIFGGPVLLMLTGKIGLVPSSGAIFLSMFAGWKLIELKKKRSGSERFLIKFRKA